MIDAALAPLLSVLRGLVVPVVAVAVVVLVGMLAPRVVGLLRQRAYDRASAREPRRWVLRLDPASAADPDALRTFIATLHPGGRRGMSWFAVGWPTIALVVRRVDGRARFEIEAPRQLARVVEAAAAAAYQGGELEPLTPEASAPPSIRLALRGEPPMALPARRGGSGFGAVLVELIARAPAGANITWRLVLRPQPPDGGDDGEPRMRTLLLDSFLNRPSQPLTRPTTSAPRPSGPVFSTTATLEASAPERGPLRSWLFDAIGLVGALEATGWSAGMRVGGNPSPMRLGPAEVGELWGIAAGAVESRPVEVVRSRRAPIPAGAMRMVPGVRPIGLDGNELIAVPEDLFARHVTLLGRTGSGKSTELIALAADDIAAGRGFTFLDPHGDAIARLLDAVPPEHLDRVHLLELAEKQRPRGFNPIELDGDDPELVAAQFVDTIHDLYFAHVAGSGHRQSQYLRSGLMTLLSRASGDHGPWTLADLYRLFLDAAFRSQIVAGIKDPILEAFWKQQWPKNAKGTGDPSADAILAKLGSFLSYPSIRDIVTSPTSTIRPRRIMDEGQVLLVDLSRVGRDNLRLFGSLLIARYAVAALGRQNLAPGQRTPHTLYVDEVQNFDTSSLRAIPAEGRKFGLALVMATQYMKGLGLELQSAIRANVATLLLLQPSAEDAHLLADLVTPLTERDLLYLPRFRMAVRTELSGESITLTAGILPEVPQLGSAAEVRRRSDARDGRAR